MYFVIVVPFSLSFYVCLIGVPLTSFCPADHVPDWQPRKLLGMVEARSVNVKKTTTTTTKYEGLFCTENVILSCVPSAVRICCLYRKLFCFYKYAHTNTAATTNNTALVNNKTEYLVQDVQNNSNINSNTCLHALISDTPSPLPAIYIKVQYCTVSSIYG